MTGRKREGFLLLFAPAALMASMTMGGNVPKYDVAVLGAGLGGLAAAALLSRKKKRTIVIERGSSLSDALGVIEKSGFGFYAGASLSYGFEPGGLLQDFFSTLGMTQRTVVPSPCYQVALPDRRVTVFADYAETLEELKREFPRESGLLARLYRDIEKTRAQSAKSRVSAYLTKHRSASGFIGRYGFSKELSAFFDVQSRVLFQKRADELSLTSFMTLCDTPPRRLQGGFRKFADQLYGVILQHGGEIRYHERSSELMMSNNRVTGVKTAQDIVEATAYIVNALPQQHRAIVFAGLQEQVVPVGMSQDVFLLQDYSRPQEIMVLSLNGSDEEATFAPARMRALSVSCRCHDEGGVVDKRMLVEKLGRLVPFLSDYLVFAEEFSPDAGYAVLPGDMIAKKTQSVSSKAGLPILERAPLRNAQVVYDYAEAPLQVLSAVQELVERTG